MKLQITRHDWASEHMESGMKTDNAEGTGNLEEKATQLEEELNENEPGQIPE